MFKRVIISAILVELVTSSSSTSPLVRVLCTTTSVIIISHLWMSFLVTVPLQGVVVSDPIGVFPVVS